MGLVACGWQVAMPPGLFCVSLVDVVGIALELGVGGPLGRLRCLPAKNDYMSFFFSILKICIYCIL